MVTTPENCETTPAKKQGPIVQGTVVRAESSVSKAQEWAGAEKDGMWGDKTSEAFQQKIEKYQKSKGLDATGKYDAKTAEAMRNDPATSDVANALNAMKKDGTLDRVYRPVDRSAELSCKAPTAPKVKIAEAPQRSTPAAPVAHHAGPATYQAAPQFDGTPSDRATLGLKALPANQVKPHLETLKEGLRTSMLQIQKESGLEQTGKYDDVTRSAMMKNSKYQDHVPGLDAWKKEGIITQKGELDVEGQLKQDTARRQGTKMQKAEEHGITNRADWLKANPEIAAQLKTPEPKKGADSHAPFANLKCEMNPPQQQDLVWRSTDKDNSVTLKGPAQFGKDKSNFQHVPETFCGDLAPDRTPPKAPPSGRAASAPSR